MNCGVPFCQSAMKLSGMVVGCPLNNLIPEWNDEIYNKRDRHAFNRLAKTSNFLNLLVEFVRHFVRRPA